MFAIWPDQRAGWLSEIQGALGDINTKFFLILNPFSWTQRRNEQESCSN